jgi:predicted dehydrogenase
MGSAGGDLRLGLLGTGFAARAHAEAVGSVPGVALVAVAAAHPESARRFAAEHAAAHPRLRPFRDLDELLASDLDAVVVAVPTHLHEEAACAALAAGRHVLLEKPMALTLEGCDRILAAVAPGRALMVGLVCRHWPHYAALRSLAASGSYGRLRSLAAGRRATFPRWSPWFADRGRSGGAALDLMVHDLDLARAFCGELRLASAVGARGPSGGWDVAQALLRGDGVQAAVECMAVDAPGYPFTMECRLVLERAVVELRGRSGGEQIGQLALSVDVYPEAGGRVAAPVPEGDPFALQLRHFAEACRGQGPTEGTGAQGREAVALALAVREALDAGEAEGSRR